MNCKRVHELMGPYLYGDLSPDEMMEVRVHTQSCAECKEDLRTRGFAVSSLDDTVPSLSEEEKQRIAWSVKGAVKEKEKTPAPFKLRLAPAFALFMVLLLVGFVIGSRITTHSKDHSRVTVSDNNEKPKATVTITESKPKDVQLKNEADASSEPARKHHRHFQFKIPFAVTGTGLVSRKNTDTSREHTYQDDSPVPVDTSVSDKPKTEPKNQAVKQTTEAKTAESKGVENGESKLPQPTDLNDAQTDTQTTSE